MPTMYNLTGVYRLLVEADAEEDFAFALQQLEGTIEEKARHTVAVIQELKVRAEGFKQEARRLVDNQRALEGRVRQVSDNLLYLLREAGLQRIVTGIGTVAVQDSPWMVEVLDASQIPPEFMRTPEPPAPEPDKRLLMDLLMGCLKNPGMERPEWLDRAVALGRGQHIRIR